MLEPQHPRYSYRQLQDAAEGFLARHHPRMSLPIPIEEIVEFQMELDIVPFPGLRKAFDIDGFTTSDLSTIYVDEYVYATYETRYRFTLAHEVGHVVLHAGFYRAHQWKSIEEWKRSILDTPDEQYSFMEWHANAFAGLVLVPDRALPAQIASCEATIAAVLPPDYGDADARFDFLAECIAQAFHVSREVASRRLMKWTEGMR